MIWARRNHVVVAANLTSVDVTLKRAAKLGDLGAEPGRPAKLARAIIADAVTRASEHEHTDLVAFETISSVRNGL
jgi:hypothetical protein